MFSTPSLARCRAERDNTSARRLPYADGGKLRRRILKRLMRGGSGPTAPQLNGLLAALMPSRFSSNGFIQKPETAPFAVPSEPLPR